MLIYKKMRAYKCMCMYIEYRYSHCVYPCPHVSVFFTRDSPNGRHFNVLQLPTTLRQKEKSTNEGRVRGGGGSRQLVGWLVGWLVGTDRGFSGDFELLINGELEGVKRKVPQKKCAIALKTQSCELEGLALKTVDRPRWS